MRRKFSAALVSGAKLRARKARRFCRFFARAPAAFGMCCAAVFCASARAVSAPPGEAFACRAGRHGRAAARQRRQLLRVRKRQKCHFRLYDVALFYFLLNARIWLFFSRIADIMVVIEPH